MIKIKNILLLIIGLFIFSCEVHYAGFHHRIKKGETLNLIAARYNLTSRILARVNKIDNPNNIKAGTLLFIPIPKDKIKDLIDDSDQPNTNNPAVNPKENNPHAHIVSNTHNNSQPTPQTTVVPDNHSRPVTKPIHKNNNGKLNPRIIWPLKGTVIKKFTIYTRGIDIECENNTPVKAAASGKVIYKDNISGFGKTIILQHENNLLTVYSHLNDYKVKLTDYVEQNKVIGLSGNSGSTSFDKTVLHFECRINNSNDGPVAVDPLKYLR